ncbi:putative carbonic anhydrase 3 isoform X1 [Drosophila ficusphila]|uniref:putative carbonic anhydrase 3 isoform X1 n=1 Tax=Drosophila ficusphila TaxID=30025 RepID=UPI0007E7C05F|nr:putative carbonic anhydrase 3 isoform X1 [Drosophila ficusphila]
MHFFTICLIVCCSMALSWASDWGYPDLDNNQDEPFPKWGGICDSGKKQSPINLHAKGALKGEFDALKFENYNEYQKNLQMINNGHTIQLSGFNHELTLSGGALLNDFVVEQVHMHWWSEHTINEIRYPLEVHIVHRNTIYPNMTMAANFKDGIVVIGVLYHVSNTPNEAIGRIIKNLGAVKSYDSINQPALVADSLAVGDLVPSVESYFTYAGSLTTPSCAEAVTWIVLTETFPVTLDQVNEFKEIESAAGKQLHNNYRELQSENNRAVVLVEQPEDRSGAAGLTASVSLIFTLILAGQKFLM